MSQICICHITNKACHITIYHVTNESYCTQTVFPVYHKWICHLIWMSHICICHVMNESCQIWICHVTNESCQIWICHVTNESCRTHTSRREWDMSYMNTSCLEWVTLHTNSFSLYITYEYVTSWMSHVWIRHLINESCHVWIRHVMNESCRIKYNPYISHMNMSLYEWVKSHTHSFSYISSLPTTQDLSLVEPPPPHPHQHPLLPPIASFSLLCVRLPPSFSLRRVGFMFELRVNHRHRERYGVATISRLHKMIGLFCRISSLL